MAVTLYATVETFDEFDGADTETLSQHFHHADPSDPEEMGELLAGYEEDLTERGHKVLSVYYHEV